MKLKLVAICALVVSGCTAAEFTSINRQFNPAQSDSRLIDAKQRAIISIPGRDGGQVICAEPSPDAVQATAAALQASGAFEQADATASLQAAAGIGDSVASIGLRTQSIQLLRDSYYRNCEGFASGALDDFAFNIMHQRFQNHTIALLAIEQLTGAAVAPAVALTSSTEADAQAPEITVNNTNTTGGESEEKSSESEESTEIGEGSGSIKTTTTVEIADPQSGRTGELPSHVSEAVAAITLDAINQDYGVQICLELVRQISTNPDAIQAAITVGEALEKRQISKAALEYCSTRLKADAERQAVINNLVSAKADIVKAVARGIAAKGPNHLSDKHALEIIEAIHIALPSDPNTAFQIRDPQITAGGLVVRKEEKK